MNSKLWFYYNFSIALGIKSSRIFTGFLFVNLFVYQIVNSLNEKITWKNLKWSVNIKGTRYGFNLDEFQLIITSKYIYIYIYAPYHLLSLGWKIIYENNLCYCHRGNFTPGSFVAKPSIIHENIKNNSHNFRTSPTLRYLTYGHHLRLQIAQQIQVDF